MKREINVPLLRKTMEHIEQHPWEWDQTSWQSDNDSNERRLEHILSTRGGAWQRLRHRYFGDKTKAEIREAVKLQQYTCDSSFCFAGWAVYLSGAEDVECSRVRDPETGESLPIEEYAQKILGISHLDACQLFTGSNSMGDLRRKVDLLIERGDAQI